MTHRRRRGVGALEFALTMPSLLLVILGIVELSLLMHRHDVVTRCARRAARMASGVLEGVEPTGDEVEEAAVDHATFALDAAGVSCGAGCMVDAEWFEDDEGWWMVAVDVEVPYQPFTQLFPILPDATRGHFVMLTQQQVFED